jgi:DNA-binding GntR family transcriptional regulator
MAQLGEHQTRASLRVLSRHTLRDRIYDGLRVSILRGSFTPGEALTVRRLAAAFGTSPTPVREALQQLVAEGALIGEPNRSYRVPRISREAFLELRDMRAELEGLAAYKAAQSIRAGEIRQLVTLSERMDRAIALQDHKAYLGANQDFHFVIYGAARSPLLLKTIGMLWMQIGPNLNMLFDDIELVVDLQDYHLAAVEAFRQGDAEAARAALRNDILTAGWHIGRRMDSAPE